MASRKSDWVYTNRAFDASKYYPDKFRNDGLHALVARVRQFRIELGALLKRVTSKVAAPTEPSDII